MERRVADILNAATSRFYAQQAQSFSQTRQSAWPGWERCLPYLDELAVARSLSLVDVGCGNLRFEAFLKSARPDFAVGVTAVDFGSALFEQARPGIFGNVQAGEASNNEARNNGAHAKAGNDEGHARGLHGSRLFDGGACAGEMCADEERSVEPHGTLAPGMHLASFQNLDLVTQALDCEPLLGVRLNGQADAVLCFGFMHHVPGCETRAFALREMLKLLHPGGLLIVSFWRFMKSPKLAAQAKSLREQAISDLKLAAVDLETGDHLLGWQKVPGVYRYCHSFSEAELDSLVVELSDLATLETRFEADGRTGNLNAYLIFRRK